MSLRVNTWGSLQAASADLGIGDLWQEARNVPHGLSTLRLLPHFSSPNEPGWVGLAKEQAQSDLE